MWKRTEQEIRLLENIEPMTYRMI